ncbi:MAG: pimeloyl-ACP methyl ester carboxylesterase [Gammaproteobacteria bacterium]|jgi:pimeloyl-ACP methyl ester carboxylesterase
MITYPMFKADAGFRAAFSYFSGVCETFGYDALACLTSWIGCAGENIFQPAQGEMAKWESACFQRNFSIDTIAETMAIVASNDFTSDLAKIKVPSLLLMGKSGHPGYQSAGTRALADEFLSQVPQAKLKTIAEGGGTYCMIEKPAETAKAIIEFVNTL